MFPALHLAATRRIFSKNTPAKPANGGLSLYAGAFRLGSISSIVGLVEGKLAVSHVLHWLN